MVWCGGIGCGCCGVSVVVVWCVVVWMPEPRRAGEWCVVLPSGVVPVWGPTMWGILLKEVVDSGGPGSNTGADVDRAVVQ